MLNTGVLTADSLSWFVILVTVIHTNEASLEYLKESERPTEPEENNEKLLYSPPVKINLT